MSAPQIPARVKKEFSKLDWQRIASLEWTEQDWCDYYEGISFALWKIAQRHKRTVEPVIDFQI